MLLVLEYVFLIALISLQRLAFGDDFAKDSGFLPNLEEMPTS